METYHGMVRTPADAIKLFEACRLGLLPRVQRRLSEKERQAIRSGSVFVWDEREAGMRRWTDGKSWSASRVSGSFLTYREMEGKRGGGGFNTMRRVSGKTPDSSGRGSDEDQDEGEPDGYRYKADGLMKQSFSITTSNGQHLHLISYYARPGPGEPDLPQPTNDPSLRSVVPAKGMYPESSMSDNTPVAPATRMPISQQHHHQPPHYAHHAPPPQLGTGAGGPYHQSQYPPPYSQPGYSWPPSPIATPPYNHHYTTVSAPYPPQQHPQQPPPPGYYPGPPQHHAPPPTLAPYGGPPPPPPSSQQYDRMPLPPPQQTGPSRTSPGLSNSPRSSLYRQPPPILPPVSSTTPSYNTSPNSRYHNLPPVSQGLLPALTATTTISTPVPPISGSSALTPPYQQQQQQQKPYYADAYANGNSPSSGGNKASLSALLHPTPTSSEPNSANAGSSNSASSSPRHLNASAVDSTVAAAAAAAATVAPTAAPAAAAAGATAATAAAGGTSLHPQQYLQPAPSGEDSRALSRLDKKFCI